MEKTPPGKTASFDTMLDEANRLYARNLDAALACLNHILALPESSQASRLRQALQLRGQVLTAQGRFLPAMEDLVRAQQIAAQADDCQGEAILLCLIGNIYILQGLYPDAMTIQLDACQTLETQGDSMWLARAYNSLGFSYHFLDQPEKAVTYLNRSIQMARELGETLIETLALDSLAHTKLAQGHKQEALVLIQRSILLLRRLGHEEYLAEYLVTLAQAEDSTGSDGSTSLAEALTIARRLHLPRHEAQALFSMGVRLMEKGASHRAQTQLEAALALAEKIGAARLAYLTCFQLSALMEGQGQYQAALTYYQSFHQKKEALLGEAAARRLQYLEIRHRIANVEQEKQNALLHNQRLEKEVKQRILLQKQAEKQARIDPLTGLFNRRHFRQCAEAQWQEAVHQGTPLSMVLFDADHFKRINDTWGHAVGDLALQAISLNLMDTARHEDLFGRYGGEEFIMLMPQTDAEQAASATQRMLLQVERHGLVHGETTIPLTLSAGIACMRPGQITSLDELIHAADQALYVAKNRGRNQLGRAPE
ncbi:diguanylate cyclase [Craterilacuibacter sp.]|uniref:diguanylate cyclase n=1 Tax=Craterilacuibacter sp. TaxID=2870909 RepID=UPI003F3C47CC